ncbi:MAG: magnesium transporter MgtE N-terminal domain-containing protein, partial [Armatimonadota bacterium]
MLFLTHILNRPVVDAAGVRLGWVEDLVLGDLDLFPRVEAIVLARRGQGAVFVPWEAIDEVGRHLRLNTIREKLPTLSLGDDAVFLRRDILDKQVVDIHGRKVVRVNDLQLAPIDHELRLVSADIGVGGLLRRLALERPARSLARTFNGHLPERLIPWNYVEGLETEWPSVKLSVPRRRLRDLPPPDIADIIAQLHPADRGEVLQQFDDETLADALPHLEDEVQAEVILAMSEERASDILEILPPDEAADVLGEMNEAQAERILHLMEPDEAEDVRELLQYDEDTAGGRMTTEYLALMEGQTAGQAMAQLHTMAPDAETIYYVYVIDAEERLHGVLSLRDLITAADDTPIADLTNHNVIAVNVHDDQETVARELNHYHLLAMPVTDNRGVLLGIVTVDDVLDVMHEEAEEDISRLAGSIEESDVLATPWEQTVLRLPWLLGAASAGLLMAIFITVRLTAVPTRDLTPLMALLPLLLLLGVQIGGQSAAATQVALAEEATLGEILRRHLLYGWPLGLALGLMASIIGGVLSAGITDRPIMLPVAGIILLVLMADMLAGSLLPLALH